MALRSLGFKKHIVRKRSVLFGTNYIGLPIAAREFSIKDAKGEGLTGRRSAAYKAKYLHPFTFTLAVPEHLVPDKLKAAK